MSDEHWRAQSTPEAIRDRETERIQSEARQRGEAMTEAKAREAADRVIAGREAFDRHLRERAEATGRELTKAYDQARADRAPGGPQMLAGRDPRADIERFPQIRRPQGRTGRGRG